MLSVSIALIGGELEEAQSLAVVFGEAATAVSVKPAEIVSCGGAALVGGEPVEACSLAIVFGEATATGFVEIVETTLRIRVTLVSVVLKKAHRLFVANCKGNAGQCNNSKRHCECQQNATHQLFLRAAWTGWTRARY